MMEAFRWQIDVFAFCVVVQDMAEEQLLKNQKQAIVQTIGASEKASAHSE
jgi:hypothetical protein